jgi:hypothetical protein
MERLVLTTTNRCTTRLHPDLLLTADLQFYCSTFAVWLQQVFSLVSPLEGAAGRPWRHCKRKPLATRNVPLA